MRYTLNLWRHTRAEHDPRPTETAQALGPVARAPDTEPGATWEPEAAPEAAAETVPAPTETPQDDIDTLRAQLARARRERNWDAVRVLCARILAREPEDLDAALALAESRRATGDTFAADAALAPVLDRRSASAELAFSHALNAEYRKDYEEALRRWHEARVAFPSLGYAWAAESTVLGILGRRDESETLLREARSRVPDSVEIAAAYVQDAILAERWIEARRRWLALEQDFPGHRYVAAVGAATRERIAAGIAGIDVTELVRDAASADAERDWSASALLWAAAHERVPDRAAFVTGLGRALRESHRFDDADAVFREGIIRHPQDVEMHANHAQVAAARRDWGEARLRWMDVVARFPEARSLWTMAATAYREAGDFAAAEDILARAVEHEPSRVDLIVQQALTAEKASDWSLAVKRWEAAQALRPDDLNLRNSRGDAIWQQQIARLESGEPAATASAQPGEDSNDGSDAERWRKLALGFEGLGDHCEFGIVQRRLGAEPIGVFRFAAISAEALIGLIDASFEQLGDPEHTELGLTAANEYLIRDTRGLYHMHTFVQKDSVDPQKFLAQQVKRLGYLKKKLIEDLRESEKVFVYKSSHERISDEVVRRMHAALGSFGPNILLAVRRHEDGRRPGDVVTLDDGILIGHLDTEYGGVERPIDLESWKRILVSAERYRTSHQRQGAGTTRDVELAFN